MTDPPTPLQVDYVRSMQRKLHLSNSLFETHCESRFGSIFAQLSKQQCSGLIDEMKAWTSIPADLLREAGQQELFR